MVLILRWPDFQGSVTVGFPWCYRTVTSISLSRMEWETRMIRMHMTEVACGNGI